MTEIHVQADVGGRRLTLDPIMDREPIPAQVVRVESSIPCGFQVDWISGEDNDPDSAMEDFTLGAGAGFGSPWMTLTIRMKDGTQIQEVVDIRPFLTDWLQAAMAAGPSPEVG